MADAILMAGGTGGVTSDDVTAKKAHVLQGYKTVTVDSDDEVVEGTIVQRGNSTDAVEFTDVKWEAKFMARMEGGYYAQSGQWKPSVKIPYSVLAQAAGVDTSKMLDSLTIAGKKGQIKMINTAENDYSLNKQNTSYGIDYGRGTFFIDLPHGNAFYHRPDGHPHTCVDAEKLGDVTADRVMRGFTATSKNGVKFVGTMPDYSTGRVVFNGATFDGTLASGVAEKDFICEGDYCAYFIHQAYRYAGIYNGGMNLALDTGMPTIRGRKIGVTLSQSVNLSPFRQVIIDYRANATVQYNPFVRLDVYITKASDIRRNGVFVGDVPKDVLGSTLATKSNIGLQGRWVIDVSNINEHALLSFVALANVTSARDVFSGSMQITKIELIN